MSNLKPSLLAAACTLLLATAWASADSSAPSKAEVQTAVNKALPMLAATIAEYPHKVSCFSCHHQGVQSVALAAAVRAGYKAASAPLAAAVRHTVSDLKTDLPLYIKGDGQPGGVTRSGYALLALSNGGIQRNEVTDAVIQFILRRDTDLAFWRARSNRPPSEFSNFTDTYLAIKALKAYGDAGSKSAIEARIAKAADWLKSSPTRDNEDLVFKVLGQSAAGVSCNEAAAELIKAQKTDGGWSQLKDGDSDAYATATALYALRSSGSLAPEDAVFQNGIRYLLKTQQSDGTWHVTTRSKPVQPYFESGFPYGKDQFISVTATGWAVTVLALASETP